MNRLRKKKFFDRSIGRPQISLFQRTLKLAKAVEKRWSVQYNEKASSLSSSSSRRSANKLRFKARVFTFLLKTKSMRIVLVGMKRETNNSIQFFLFFFSQTQTFFFGQRKKELLACRLVTEEDKEEVLSRRTRRRKRRRRRRRVI